MAKCQPGRTKHASFPNSNVTKGILCFNLHQQKRRLRSLATEPIELWTSSIIYLHPWRSQFNPKAPQGIWIPLWFRFPHLDDVYYRALREISASIGEVVWSGRQEDYLNKASTPRVCVLVADVSKIPASILLPIPQSSKEVKIILQYEGIAAQCTNCLELGHHEGKLNVMPSSDVKPTDAGTTSVTIDQTNDNRLL